MIRIYFQNRFVRYSQSISLKDYQKVICFNFRKTLLSFFLQWKELGTGIWSGHVVLGNFEILPILSYYPLLSCPPSPPPAPPPKKKWRERYRTTVPYAEHKSHRLNRFIKYFPILRCRFSTEDQMRFRRVFCLLIARHFYCFEELYIIFCFHQWRVYLLARILHHSSITIWPFWLFKRWKIQVNVTLN